MTLASATPITRYYRAPRHNTRGAKARALRDCLAQVKGDRVTSSKPIGRCDILLCRGEAYTKIGETLICNACLKLLEITKEKRS